MINRLLSLVLFAFLGIATARSQTFDHLVSGFALIPLTFVVIFSSVLGCYLCLFRGAS
jgi:hypothetical protein